MTDPQVLEFERDREEILAGAVPVHASIFPPQPKPQDPLHLHVERIPALPGTNPAILSGGLGGGIY